jgi:hypothetical protein
VPTTTSYRKQALKLAARLTELNHAVAFNGARAVSVTNHGYFTRGVDRMHDSNDRLARARAVDARLTKLIDEYGDSLGDKRSLRAAHNALGRAEAIHSESHKIVLHERKLLQSIHRSEHKAQSLSAGAVVKYHNHRLLASRQDMHRSHMALGQATKALHALYHIPKSRMMQFELQHGAASKRKNLLNPEMTRNKARVEQRQQVVGTLRTQVLRMARHEVGVREVGGENLGRRINTYRRSVLGYNGEGYAWCAAFASWLYNRAGAPLVDKNGDVWTVKIADWAKKNHDWHPQGTSYKPKPGDLIFFKYSEGAPYYVNHVGIVESVKNGQVHTIEGNWNDQVSRNTWSLGYGPIVGYVSMGQ